MVSQLARSLSLSCSLLEPVALCSLLFSPYDAMQHENTNACEEPPYVIKSCVKPFPSKIKKWNDKSMNADEVYYQIMTIKVMRKSSKKGNILIQESDDCDYYCP